MSKVINKLEYFMFLKRELNHFYHNHDKTWAGIEELANKIIAYFEIDYKQQTKEEES